MQRPDVVCLQEAKMLGVSRDIIRDMWGKMGGLDTRGCIFRLLHFSIFLIITNFKSFPFAPQLYDPNIAKCQNSFVRNQGYLEHSHFTYPLFSFFSPESS